MKEKAVAPENAGARDTQLALFPGEIVLDYTIRVSSRARTMRLNMTPRDGLVVVIPSGYNHKHIPAFIAEKQKWIEKARVWAEGERQRLAVREPLSIPDGIELQAIGETWSVTLRQTDSSRATVREHDRHNLVLSGPADKPIVSLAALNRWTARKARASLAPWLEDISTETGLGFDRINIGNQRTRWGSCSPSGTISLNMKLMFLPERLVRYVLVHELCHSAHMNHSQRFWSRVKRHEPACAALRKELGDAWRLVPAWLND